MFFFSFGRRITILIFMITLTFSSLGAAFSPNMETFIVIRLAIAASAVAVWTTGFVYSKIFFPFSSLFFPQFSLFLPPIPLFLYSHIPTPWSGILSCSRHRTTKFPNSESPIFCLLAWSNSRARHSAIYILKSRNLS